MYNHTKVEQKWQAYWEQHQSFQTDTGDFSKPKYYVLDMFPYPSGQGLHVGHPEGYTATDIIARAKRMQGYNVLHPMGWDAFGLPAEQYAIKTGHHPGKFTQENINNFRRQIKTLGLSYDWSREFATTDPSYYKWTQWIFIQLYQKGLAYVDEIPVNFCPELGTVLANEEVINGKSERGGYDVIRVPMRQWVLKITDYAQRLLDDLDLVDWPQSTKEMQRNWIGKSVGSEVIFSVAEHELQFTVFTTRADTLFGATYCVLAPEHPFVSQITTPAQQEAVSAYVSEAAHKSDLDRTELNKEKTGVFTGAYAINPVNGQKLPIWIADYVLASYGTGAIMAVPAHDQRDYDFATTYGIDIIPVLAGGDISQEAFTGDGVHINSGFLDGMGKQEAIQTMNDWLSAHHVGGPKVSYKLRDWLFSRQRYWGEPIPIIQLADGTMRTVELSDLPLELPALEEYRPAPDGHSPLANATDWVNLTVDGQPAKRETNTMPQWAGSCWYYLRFIDPHNDQAIGDPKLLDHWLPVDLYVGGAEHAVLHLLYARFWHKVLYDLGVVHTKEPFQKLFHQGMILGENGEKMSKSRGNVINPDAIIESHGADALRVYEMFMGPLEDALPWSSAGLDGALRWLDRVYRLFSDPEHLTQDNDHALDYSYHATVKKVTEDIEALKLNTAISQMMIFINDCYKQKAVYRPYALGFIRMFSAFAPHLGSELHELMSGDPELTYQPWPTYDEELATPSDVTIAVSINGKLRGRFTTAIGTDKETLAKQALALPSVIPYLEGKQIRRVIAVVDKIVNIVIQ